MRRNDMNQWVPAEQAIASAISTVESLPADERLTNAVTLLVEAQSQVADFIDGNKLRWSSQQELGGIQARVRALEGLLSTLRGLTVPHAGHRCVCIGCTALRNFDGTQAEKVDEVKK